MDEETEIIDLKRVRFPKWAAQLLRSIKDSGSSKHDTFAPLVRLYVLMGLTLHKQGIHTVEQLEDRLKGMSNQDVERLKFEVLQYVKENLTEPPKKKPRSK